MINWKEVPELFQPQNWWILLVLGSLYVVKQISLPDFSRWWVNRNKQKLQFVSDQLASGQVLTPVVQEYLQRQKKVLLLQIMEGVKCKPELVDKLVELTHNEKHSISWPIIKKALPFIILNEQDQIDVKVDLLSKIIACVGTVLSIPFIFLYVFAWWATSHASNLSEVAILLLVVAWSLMATFFFITPLSKILSAYRIEKKLHPEKGRGRTRLKPRATKA